MKTARFLSGFIILTLVLTPIYWITVSSFKSSKEIIQSDITFIPEQWTMENYVDLLTQTNFLTNLINSSVVAAGTVILSVLIVLPASYALYRLHFKGRKTISILLIITYVFPGALLLIPIYQIFSSLGLTNTLFGLIVINVTFTAPFSTWLMQGFYDSVPSEIEEAAQIDGAGRFKSVILVLLPLISPGVATIAIYSLVISWTEYMFASILIIDDGKRTLPVGLSAVMGQYNINWGALAAGSVLTALPIIILFTFFGKYFVKGLTDGAVK